MKCIKFITLIGFLIIILNGCSSFTEAGKVLRNEKVQSTDEFLVKKKKPLRQPPDFETIPEPGSTNNLEQNKSSIKEILKKSNNKSNKSPSPSSSIEDSIINQIKK